ncbi:MAG: hypothetical protein RL748_1191 [Pseudomonadota bacterium]|jgi:sensor histidine kinase YesM
MTPFHTSMPNLPLYLLSSLVLGVLLAVALVNTGVVVSASPGAGMLAGQSVWLCALLFALPVTLVYGFITASAYYVCRAQSLAQRRFWMTLGTYLAASLISGLMWLLLCHVWNNLLAQVLPGSADGTNHERLLHLSRQTSVLLLLAGCGVYLLSLLLHDVVLALENMRSAERRASEAQIKARDAELQVLRAQINPHFLFNSLNSISALTSIDPAAARSMTLSLSQFFRLTLSLSERERITLAEEIELCEHFLAVEKIRFGKKLQARFMIADAARAALIPPMLLQPCIENAIKHGIRDLTEGGTISISAQLSGDWLHLTIVNPIEVDDPEYAHLLPKREKSAGTGTGLKNIRQRFASLYGERARASWGAQAAQFSVELVLPLILSPGAAQTAPAHPNHSSTLQESL